MIGNDLIYLPLAVSQNKFSNSRFINKVFSDSEKAILKDELSLWTIWAVKEACYKIENRKKGERKFNPKSFQVDINRQKVETENGVYHFEIDLKNDYLHVICYSKKRNYTLLFFESNSIIHTTKTVNKQIEEKLKNQSLSLVFDKKGVPTIQFLNKNYSATISHDFKKLALAYII